MASAIWNRRITLATAALLGCSVPLFAQSAPPPLNLHVVVTEEFLNRFVARQDVQPGPVNEMIQDVRVEGEQCTFTALRLDLLPATQAHAQFILHGEVQSHTVGLSDQAVVHSVGQQHFRAVKDVYFDGQLFSTRHATVSVQANNQPVSIQTRFDGTPLQGIANRMAVKVIEQRKPATTELAKQRITERVTPPFDSGVDQKLADANERLENNVRAFLRKYDLLPETQQVLTTDRHLHYAASLGSRSTEPLPPPGSNQQAAHAVTLFVHETALNGILDRLPLKGYRTTDRALRRLSSPLGDRSTQDDEPEGALGGLPLNLETEIEFDAERPVSIQLRDNLLILRLRVTLRTAGQSLVPPAEIAISFRMTSSGRMWRIAAENTEVQAQRPEERIPDVAATMIREAIEASLPTRDVPRELPVPGWPVEKPKLQLSGILSADGWLIIGLD